MQAHQKGSDPVSAKNANDRLAEEDARADAMIAELTAPPAAAPGAPNPPAVPEPAAAPVEPAPAADEPVVDTQAPPAAEPSAEPVPAEPEPEPQPAAPPDDADARILALEAKFKTLQGKYNAEVPIAAARVRELSQENQVLRQMLTEQRTAAPAAPPAPGGNGNGHDAPGARPLDPQLVEKLKASMGEEGFEALQSMNENDRKAFLAAQSEAQRQMQKLTEQTQRMAFESFKHQLGEHFGDWETLNNDDGFNSWLNEPDPLAGVPRRALLDDAARNYDARRAAVFFQTYHALQAPATPRAPVPPPVRKVRVQTPSLEAQVKPRTAGGATPPAAPAKKYTGDEYRKLGDQVLNLRNSNPKRSKELELELDRALVEGRVTA